WSVTDDPRDLNRTLPQDPRQATAAVRQSRRCTHRRDPVDGCGRDAAGPDPDPRRRTAPTGRAAPARPHHLRGHVRPARGPQPRRCPAGPRYEAWLLDWRGSCRLPYNESAARYTFDDVALYDIPAAVTHIRNHIGQQPLFVV